MYIPSKLQETLADPRWTKAMAEEMVQKNSTCHFLYSLPSEPLPKGKKTVGYKRIFTIKHKADGSIERYKARLIAKGYTRVDYQESKPGRHRVDAVKQEIP